MVTAPTPSAVAGRASSRTTWSPGSRSSAASSMVMMRSRRRHQRRRGRSSSVVLPDDVGPLTTTLAPRGDERLEQGDDVGRGEGGERPRPRREAPDAQARAVDGERRDDGVDAGAVGQAGVDDGRGAVDAQAERRDDPLDEVLGRRRRRGRSPVRSRRPARSTHTSRPALTITSVTSGSASSGSSGPRPSTRATTRATSAVEVGRRRAAASSASAWRRHARGHVGVGVGHDAGVHLVVEGGHAALPQAALERAGQAGGEQARRRRRGPRGLEVDLGAHRDAERRPRRRGG